MILRVSKEALANLPVSNQLVLVVPQSHQDAVF